MKPKIFKVTRKSGALVLQYGMKALVLHERDAALDLVLPEFPKAGKSITFEIKKVEK